MAANTAFRNWWILRVWSSLLLLSVPSMSQVITSISPQHISCEHSGQQMVVTTDQTLSPSQNYAVQFVGQSTTVDALLCFVSGPTTLRVFIPPRLTPGPFLFVVKADGVALQAVESSTWISVYNWSAITPILESNLIRATGGNTLTIQFQSPQILPPSATVKFSKSRESAPIDSPQVSGSVVVNRLVVTVPSGIYALYKAGVRPYLLIGFTPATTHATGLRLRFAPLNNYAAGFAFGGSVDDQGWTFSHNQGRLRAASTFGPSVLTSFRENVGASPQALQSYAVEEDLDVLFVCGHGFFEASLQAAASMPDTQFVVLASPAELRAATGSSSPPLPLPNLSILWVQLYRARYLSGIVAGGYARHHNISRLGYVMASQNPLHVAGVNAFALGVRFLQPNAQVVCYTVGGGNNEYAAQQAATVLLQTHGVQIMAASVNSNVPLKTAIKAGKFGVGSYADQQKLLGEKVLGGAQMFWAQPFTDALSMLLDNSTPFHRVYDMARGGSGLSAVSGLVESTTKVSADSFLALYSQQPTATPFSGPLYDSAGQLRLRAGQTLSVANRTSLDWFVQGVRFRGRFTPQLPYEDSHLLGGARYVAVGTTLLSWALCALAGGWAWRQRSLEVLRFSSGTFCLVLVAGVAALQFATLAAAVDESLTHSQRLLNAACLAIPWFAALPTTTIYGVLFLRVWRVHRLFRNRRMRTVHIRTSQLLRLVLFMNLPVLAVLVVWTWADPLHWQRVTLRRDSFGYALSSYGGCTSRYSTPFAASLFGYTACVLVSANYLGFRSRHAPSRFNESTWLNLTFVNLTEVSLVMVPLHYLATTHPPSLFVLRLVFVAAVGWPVLGFTFIPKYLQAKLPPDAQPPTAAVKRRRATTSVHATATATRRATVAVAGGGKGSEGRPAPPRPRRRRSSGKELSDATAYRSLPAAPRVDATPAPATATPTSTAAVATVALVNTTHRS